MNVLFNLPSVPQYSAMFQMCKSLAGMLDSLTVVTNESDPIRLGETPSNLHVLELPRSKPRFLSGLLSETGCRKADIIHDTFGYFIPLGALAKLSSSKKYVTSVWGSSAGWCRKAVEIGFGDEAEISLNRGLARREQINSMLCDAIMVNSQAFVEDYVEYFNFPRSKVFEVPECVTVDPKLGYSGRPDGPFRILYVGHISKMKGIHLLLEAFQKLVAEGREARLTAVGRFVPHDRKIIEAKDWEGVEFVGPLPQPELAPYFRQADLFVLPSYMEGMPRVVMEALSWGVPVIASDLPGIRRLDDSGRLIRIMPDFNASNLKDILAEEMSRRRKTEQFFLSARNAMASFSPENTANKIFEVYNSL
ncbi:MAG: glycosyltransferase family 4 protein [Methanobacteriota archaeon]